MKRVVILSLVLVGGCLFLRKRESSFLISPERKLTILLPSSPCGTEKLAAEELRTYLGRITQQETDVLMDSGERPEGPVIVISSAEHLPAWLAPPGRRPLEKQELLMRIANDAVLLSGGRSGVLYATYKFLEDFCGVHWFMPGELGEVLPEQESITLSPTKIREKPAFEIRSIVNSRFPDRNAIMLWMLRNRLTIDKGRYDPRIYKEFWSRMDKLAVKPDDIGVYRGMVGNPFKRLVPPDMFKEHPEWFTMKRGNYYPRGQLTLHAPGLMVYIVGRIRKFFDENRDADSFSLCPNDGSPGWSEDSLDTRWDGPELWGPFPVVTDRLMHSMSIVAGELKKTHPNKAIYTYAYTPEYNRPPRFIKKNSHRMCRLISFINTRLPAVTSTASAIEAVLRTPASSLM